MDVTRDPPEHTVATASGYRMLRCISSSYRISGGSLVAIVSQVDL